MVNESALAEELVVGRGDPVYMAHAYLTKVPVPAILPFIEANTEPGDTVADPFAGSGMTGVAAAMLGRAGRLSDISVLGRHIGRNFVNLVDEAQLSALAEELERSTRKHVGDVYAVRCLGCNELGQLSKSVWTILVECSGCGANVNYYRAMEHAQWRKSDMVCPHCLHSVSSKNRRVGEEAVLDYVSCACSDKQREQPSAPPPVLPENTEFPFPDVEITADRQMYQASALGKSGLVKVASYYSERNRAVLATLRGQISDVQDERLRNKLLFAFTACLTRASKRYQWSRARPLNAANANYYVAPVFYEWNVYELFARKVISVGRADSYVRSTRRLHVSAETVDQPDVTYELASAERLPLEDASVSYVFTDPPFGSNLFYADMALFHEGWIGDDFTDVGLEAVIDRSRDGKRSAERYERLITDALSECRRVVKPGGRISMVFGNSSGKVWAMVQRAIAAAGLRVVPEALVVLNKGQRSVKGLASGFEHVATLDLIITMEASEAAEPARHPSADEVRNAIRSLIGQANSASPSHLYLELLRSAFRNGWSVADLDLRHVTAALLAGGWDVDGKTGKLQRQNAGSQDAVTSALNAID